MILLTALTDKHTQQHTAAHIHPAAQSAAMPRYCCQAVSPTPPPDCACLHAGACLPGARLWCQQAAADVSSTGKAVAAHLPACQHAAHLSSGLTSAHHAAVCKLVPVVAVLNNTRVFLTLKAPRQKDAGIRRTEKHSHMCVRALQDVVQRLQQLLPGSSPYCHPAVDAAVILPGRGPLPLDTGAAGGAGAARLGQHSFEAGSAYSSRILLPCTRPVICVRFCC